MANLVLATCQFPVDKDCEQNLKYVTRQIINVSGGLESF